MMRWLVLIALVRMLAAEAAQAGFTDVTLEAGVDYLQWHPQPGNLESMRITGGAAAGDLDGDGYPDLLVTRLDAPDIFFRNDQQGGFVDERRWAGFRLPLPSNGAALGDLDNDGDLDLYITAVGDRRHYMYENDGSGRFREVGARRNAVIETKDNHLGMSTTFGDYNRDGYLDIHVTEWGNYNYEPQQLWSHARLLRNVGAANPAHFVDATLETGVFLDEYVGYSPNDSRDGLWTFTSTFADFDRDGHPDLAIAGDFHTSRLYWNDGDGTFTLAPGADSTYPSGIGTDENGMGSAVADFNGDGLLDWFVTAIFDSADPCHDRRCNWNGSGNRLYLNNGDRTFTDVTDQAGVRDGGWGWGSTFFDYDNDGDLDLTMTNGMIADSEYAEPFFEDPMKLWRNNGDGTFTEVAQAEGLTDTGAGKGLLTVDYDLDGDLDLFVVNNGDHPKLYRNDANQANAFLKVQLQGTRSNRDGIGAFVTVLADADGTAQTRYVTGGGTNYLSQSDMTVHFGLGPRTQPLHQLVIDWPLGTKQIFSDVNINTTLRAVEPIPEPSSSVIVMCGAFCLFLARIALSVAQRPCYHKQYSYRAEPLRE